MQSLGRHLVTAVCFTPRTSVNILAAVLASDQDQATFLHITFSPPQSDG